MWQGPIFQVTNSNRKLTQLRSSEIHYQPSPNAQNDSLDIQQPEISRTYHKYV